MRMEKELADLIHTMLETDLLDPAVPVVDAIAIAPRAWMPEVTVELVRHFTSRGIAGAFVSFRRTHEQLVKDFQQQDIDLSRLFIIDTLSAVEHQGENALHVRSPRALTDIKIALGQFAERVRGRHFVVIETLDELTNFHSETELARFIGELIAMARPLRLTTIGLLNRDPGREAFERRMASFFGKVIHLG